MISNPLKKLETFKCAQSQTLTLKVNKKRIYLKKYIISFQSVKLLMNSCPNLIACMDLEYWESISRQDLLKFVENQRERNVKLKTSVEKDDDFESAGGLCATAHLPENVCYD